MAHAEQMHEICTMQAHCFNSCLTPEYCSDYRFLLSSQTYFFSEGKWKEDGLWNETDMR